MPASFLHGVETIEITKGARTITTVKLRLSELLELHRLKMLMMNIKQSTHQL